MTEERRRLSRREFSYYMRVLDDVSGKVVGHLADISANGFKLDCRVPVPLQTTLNFRVDQTESISNKSYITFSARAQWSHVDDLDPNLYNVGFQIISMSPEDYEIFLKMFNTYGQQSAR